MSSLQKQLAAIAATSTNELDLKAQKSAHSQSLLFEPAIAGRQSFDLLFQICFQGYQELCMIDARFATFQQSLFSNQSKNEDRVRMTKDENANLSKVIESFLGLVGARLMIKPALKAIEWLVRRFRIHELDTEFTVLTFLPYHSTEHFTTLLKILPSRLPQSLNFLHAYIASVSNPARKAIARAAITNQSFFSALNRYTLSVAKAKHQHDTLLSFWATITAQAVDGKVNTSRSGLTNIQRQREEAILEQLLPMLDEALAIKKAPGLVLGCYMVITVLVSKAELAEPTLHALFEAVILNWTNETVEAGLSCAAIIAEQMQSYKFTRRVTRNFLKVEHLPNRLEDIRANHSIQNLTLFLSQGILDLSEREVDDIILDVVEYALKGSVLNHEQRDYIAALVEQISSKDIPNALKTQLRAVTAAANHDITQTVDTSYTQDDRMDVDEPELDLKHAVIEDETKLAQQFDDFLDNLFNPECSYLSSSSSELFFKNLKTFDSIQVLWANKYASQIQQRFSETSTWLSPMTFLIRTWCSSKSVNSRENALKITKSQLSVRCGSDDVEALLPFIIIALSDEATKVRRKAVEVAVLLNEKIEKKFGDTAIASWGSELYKGHDIRDIPRLAPKDVAKFVSSCILSNLEECVTDPEHMGRALRHCLDSTLNHEQPTIEIKSMKSSQKSAIFSAFSARIRALNVSIPALRLLTLLNSIEKIAGHPRSNFLLPMTKEWALIPETKLIGLCASEHVTPVEFIRQLLRTIHASDKNAVDFLTSLAEVKDSGISIDLQRAAFSRIRQIWRDLRENKQREVIERLMDQSFMKSVEGSICHSETANLLRAVTIEAATFVTLLESFMKDFSSNDRSSTTKKRRRNSAGATEAINIDNSNEDTNFAKLAVLLETIEAAKIPANLDLLNTIFKVLRNFYGHQRSGSNDINYFEGLIMSCLYSVLKVIETDAKIKIDTSGVRTDLLVDCVRNTSNPQARNFALLILASLARYMPRDILQKIMPIFTLMGTTTARASDEMSAHIVDQTIQEVVPLLAQTLRQDNKDISVATAELLLSFAAAFDHIPPPRRLRLFTLLATSIGIDESLFVIIAALINHDPDNLETRAFILHLTRQFTGLEFLVTARNYLDFVLLSFAGSKNLSLYDQVTKVERKSKSTGQRPLKDIMSVIPQLFRDDRLRANVRSEINQGSANVEEIRQISGAVLEKVLQVARLTENEPALRTTASEILRELMNLFPFDQFATSAVRLIDSIDEELCRSLLKSLEFQVDSSHGSDPRSKDVAFELIPSLSRLFDREVSSSLLCSAISCIDKICGKFGKANPTALFEAAKSLSDDKCLRHADVTVRTLSLHCLASMVAVLQNEFIPLLRNVLDASAECLTQSLVNTKISQKLHSASCAFYLAALEYVPFMVPETSLKGLIQLMHRSSSAKLGGEAEVDRGLIWRAISNLEIRQVCIVASATWASAIKEGSEALQDHIRMLAFAIESNTKSSITRTSRELFEFFLQALDIRSASVHNTSVKTLTETGIEDLEQATIKAILAMVLKINDTIFRPFFVRLVEWSSTSSKSERAPRLLTLFHFLFALSEQFQRIVTSYFGYVLDLSKDILGQSGSGDKSTHKLQGVVMQALGSAFKNDHDDYWQAPARFNTILAPLVAQLKMHSLSKINSEVIPAITELASAASSNEQLKEMNTHLLKHLRSENARTRLAALRCEHSLTDRIGEEWLSLLPEMLPLINELQDDDDETVEKETHKWIKDISAILGEDLYSMLQ